MTEVLFRVADSYASINNRYPFLAVIWNPETRRLVARSDRATLTRSLVCCALIMGLFNLGPKFLQICYLLDRARQLGHFPSSREEAFAEPRHLISIALGIIGSGGSILASFFAVFLRMYVIPNSNAILAMNELLSAKGRNIFLIIKGKILLPKPGRIWILVCKYVG